MTSRGRLQSVIRDRVTMLMGAGPASSFVIDQIYSAACACLDEEAHNAQIDNRARDALQEARAGLRQLLSTANNQEGPHAH